MAKEPAHQSDRKQPSRPRARLPATAHGVSGSFVKKPVGEEDVHNDRGDERISVSWTRGSDIQLRIKKRCFCVESVTDML